MWRLQQKHYRPLQRLQARFGSVAKSISSSFMVPFGTAPLPSLSARAGEGKVGIGSNL